MARANLTRGSGFFADLGRWSFTRPVETVDGTGLRTGVNTPRFALKSTAAGAPGPFEIVDDKLGDGSTILNAGFDLDGITPILLVHSGVERQLRIYRENRGVMTRLRIFQCSTDPFGLFAGDVLGRAVLGCPVGTKAFSPASAVIVRGTLIVICRVYRKVDNATWRMDGVGIAYSTDLGESWNEFWDDADDPINPGFSRCMPWAMTNYYCPYYDERRGAPLLEVVVPFVDYLHANDSRPATGGRIGWFKLTRKNEEERFEPLRASPFEGGGPRIGVYTLRSSVASGRYSHIHSAGVAEYMPGGVPNGWQIIAAVGDGGSSSMLRIIVPDTKRYWEPRDRNGRAKWLVRANWHGTMDSAIFNPAANDGFGAPGPGGTLRGDGNIGNQFVGVGPGPTPGTLLLGADAHGEGMWILEPGHAVNSKPKFATAVGDRGTIDTANCFLMRVPRPEKKPRTVVCDYMKSPHAQGRLFPRSIDGLWISRDSGLPGTWGFFNLEGFSQFFASDDQYIYVTTPSGRTLYRRALPKTLTGRPLAVGPGGGQWLRDNPTRQFFNGRELQLCTRDAAGRWWSPSMSAGGPSTPINPQPPVCVDAVWRVAKALEDPSGQIAYCIPSATHPTRVSAISKSGPVLPGPGPRVLRARWWMLNNSGVANDSPFEAAGRSPCNSMTRFFHDNGPGGFASLGSPQTLSSSRWEAVCAAAEVPLRDGEQFGLAIGQAFVRGDGDFFIAWSELVEGHGAFGYPLPPDPCDCPSDVGGGLWTNGVSGATHWPDERAVIASERLTGTWTLLGACRVPDDSWDQYSLHAPNGTPYPILTLTEDNEAHDDWITISASPLHAPPQKLSCLELASSIGPERARTGPAVFFRGHTILFAIVCDSTGIALHATVGGQASAPVSIASSSIAQATFTRMQLGGRPGVIAPRVGPFDWFGIETSPIAMTPEAVLRSFRSLDFLE